MTGLDTQGVLSKKARCQCTSLGPWDPLAGSLLSALCLLLSIITVLIEGPLDPSIPARHLYRAVSDHRNHSAKKVLLSLCHR